MSQLHPYICIFFAFFWEASFDQAQNIDRIVKAKRLTFYELAKLAFVGVFLKYSGDELYELVWRQSSSLNDIHIYNDHHVRTNRLLDYSHLNVSQADPGDELVALTEVESMYVVDKYQNSISLLAHQQGDKITMMATTFIDPLFAFTDNYASIANISETYPGAHLPYPPYFGGSKGEISFMRMLNDMKHGGPLP